jgi:2-methylcitrate dehydratase
VVPEATLSARFPQALPARLEVELQDGTRFHAERDDYHGFHTWPFDWKAARAKFDAVTRDFISDSERNALAEVIATLDDRPVVALTSLLRDIRVSEMAA